MSNVNELFSDGAPAEGGSVNVQELFETPVVAGRQPSDKDTADALMLSTWVNRQAEKVPVDAIMPAAEESFASGDPSMYTPMVEENRKALMQSFNDENSVAIQDAQDGRVPVDSAVAGIQARQETAENIMLSNPSREEMRAAAFELGETGRRIGVQFAAEEYLDAVANNWEGLVDDEKTRIEKTYLYATKSQEGEASPQVLVAGEVGDRPLETPAYDPTDLVADIMAPGASTVFRKGIKALFDPTKKLPKFLSSTTITASLKKQMAAEGAFSALAGGFIGTADALDSGETVQFVSGILGPMGTMALMTTTRRGLMSFMKRYSVTNPDKFKKLMDVDTSTPMGKKLNEAFENFATLGEAGGIEYAKKPLASLADAANFAGDTTALKDSVGVIHSNTSASKSLTGADDSIPQIGIYGEEVIDNPQSILAYQLNQVKFLTDEMGEASVYKGLTDNALLKETQNLLSIRVVKDQYDVGVSDLGWKEGIGNRLHRVLGLPQKWLKDKATDLVSKSTHYMLQETRLNKALASSMENIRKSVSPKEYSQVLNMMDAVNRTGEPVKVVKGGFEVGSNFFSLNDKQMAAYASLRYTMDWTHVMLNNTARDQAVKRGYKWSRELGDAVRVERVGDKIKVISDKDGKVRVFDSVEEAGRDIRDIKNTDTLVDYYKDYVPILYKDKYKIVQKSVNEKTGQAELKMTHTAKSLKEADEFLAKSGVAGMVLREGEDALDLAMSRGFVDPLQSLSAKQTDALAESLAKEGISETQVNSVLRLLDSTAYTKHSRFKQRGDRLLSAKTGEVAELVPADEAISKYFTGMSKYIASEEYTRSLRKKFRTTYGQYLADSTSVFSPVRENVDPLLKREVEVVQNHLALAMGKADLAEKAAESYKNAQVQRLHDKGNPTAAALLDKIPNHARIVSGIKGATAQAKLGMFNMSQIFMQATGTLNTIGKNLFVPGALAKGGKDAALVWDSMATGKANKMSELYRKSGFGDTVGYAYLSDTFTRAKGVRGVFKKFSEYGQMAFNAGEGINRSLAWFTTRANMIKETKKGKLDMEVDGEAFLAECNRRSSYLALNMSKFNQPGFTKGIWGVPTQFLQFISHQFDLMVGKQTTLLEKAGIWGAWIGTFGASGVPFFWDAVALGERGVAKATGQAPMNVVGTTEETLYEESELASRGGLYYITDGTVDLSRRAGLSRVFEEMFNVHSPADAAGPGVDLTRDVLMGTIQNVEDVVTWAQSGRKVDFETMSRRITSVAPGIDNPISAIKALSTGKLEDRKGKLLIEKPDLIDVIFKGLGVTPAELVESSRKKSLDYKVQNIFKDWMSSTTKEIAEVSKTDPKFAAKMHKDALEQVFQFDPTKAGKFNWWVIQRTLEYDLSEEEREKLREARSGRF